MFGAALRIEEAAEVLWEPRPGGLLPDVSDIGEPEFLVPRSLSVAFVQLSLETVASACLPQGETQFQTNDLGQDLQL